MENTSAGSGDATVDSSLADGLPGDTGMSIDVLKMDKQKLNQEAPINIRHRVFRFSVYKLTVCPMVVAKVSAIQDISLSPVLISGAGTSMPGPVEPQKPSEYSQS